MDQATVQIAMRYFHLLSAILMVGGLGFLAVCLTPATRLLDDGFSASWMKIIQQRFARLLWLGMGGLVISGVYNWVQSAGTYKDIGPVGNALIGTKVLLAFVIFAVIWAGLMGLIKPRIWQKSALHLSMIVILLATVLRYFRLEQIQTAAGGG